MKKPNNSKSSPAKKIIAKGKETGEVKKTTKLKPLKEKEKQNWKNNLNDEDEDFTMEDDEMKLDSNFDEEDEDDGFFDDKF